jgi:hypothetical protein
MRPRLRLYSGDNEGGLATQSPQVAMKFSEFFQVVAEASRFKRTWLRDFADDEVQVPEDLYEVLSAYWTLRPGA